VPEVGAGEPVAARAPALEAVRWLVAEPVEEIVVLAAGAGPATFPSGSEGSFAGYGVDLRTRLPGRAHGPGAEPLPLGLAVAGWLLDAAGWTGPTTGLTCGAAGELPPVAIDGAVTGLLVMGDGSARRTEKAPGWLDERAGGFDAAVSAALASGDPTRLQTDLALAAELLAAGAPAWAAAGGLLAGQSWSAAVSYDDAPYGVGYFVARWSLPADPAAPGPVA
jgi:hypothetical protein